MAKTTREILLGALKVVLYAGGSAAIVGLIDYLRTLTLAEGGVALVVINVIIYVLIQVSQNLKSWQVFYRLLIYFLLTWLSKVNNF